MASTSSAKNIKTEGVEDDVVFCLIDLYIFAYSDWVTKPIVFGTVCYRRDISLKLGGNRRGDVARASERAS